MIMKAISLWNPWASFVSWEEKLFETRSWYTPYRGTIAIHASKTVPALVKKLCYEQPFISVLSAHEIGPSMAGLAFGSVIGVCNLANVLYIAEDGLRDYQHKNVGKIIAPLPTGNELAFGDYSPGRFAWKLEKVHRLEKPIPIKGRQGLWNWDAPDEVLSVYG